MDPPLDVPVRSWSNQPDRERRRRRQTPRGVLLLGESHKKAKVLGNVSQHVALDNSPGWLEIADHRDAGTMVGGTVISGEGNPCLDQNT